MASGQEVDPMWAVESTALPSPPENSPSLIAHRGFAGEYPENTWVRFGRPRRKPTGSRSTAGRPPTATSPCFTTTDSTDSPRDRVWSQKPRARSFSGPRSGKAARRSRGSIRSQTPFPKTSGSSSISRVGSTPPPRRSKRKRTGTGFRWRSKPSPDSPIRSSSRRSGRARWRPLRRQATFRPRSSSVKGTYHGLAVANRYDCAAIHPAARLVTDSARESGPDLVSRAHDTGLSVNVWSPVTRYEAGALAAAGVDGIVSDYSDVPTPRTLP